MQRRFFIGLIAFFGLALAAPRDLATIQSSGVLKVATDASFAPFHFLRDKAPAGFEPDLVAAIAKKLNLKLEWQVQPFDTLLGGLGVGGYDLVTASHTINDARAAKVDFTAPHYCTGPVIVSKEGKLTTPANLRGKRIAVVAKTTYFDVATKIPGVRVKLFPKDTDALSSVIAGTTDAYITDKFIAKDAIRANPQANLGKGPLLGTQRVGMAVAKGNAALLEAVNTALAEVLKDGTYATLSSQYFGEDIRCP